MKKRYTLEAAATYMKSQRKEEVKRESKKTLAPEEAKPSASDGSAEMVRY